MSSTKDKEADPAPATSANPEAAQLREFLQNTQQMSAYNTRAVARYEKLNKIGVLFCFRR